MTTEYDQKAAKFLTDTNSSIDIVFDEHGKHFIDDTENRDIYKFTISRGSRSQQFSFGQSINNSLYPVIDEQRPHASLYTIGNSDCYINRSNRGLTIEGKESELRKTYKDQLNPSPYDILSVITTSDPSSFEYFCSDYGYNVDSIKAEKIYKAVLEEYNKIATLYSDDELNRLQEIL